MTGVQLAESFHFTIGNAGAAVDPSTVQCLLYVTGAQSAHSSTLSLVTGAQKADRSTSPKVRGAHLAVSLPI